VEEGDAPPITMLLICILNATILVRYRYTDPSTSGGSWVYRVKDCDARGEKNVLCQCFVEVQSERESKTQSVSLAKK
jgi:hypothetical protein